MPRSLDFPWKAMAVSVTRGLTRGLHSVVYSGYFGLCVRVMSRSKYAYDELDGVPCKTEFPHVILKYPGVTHNFSFTESRETFEIKYPDSYLPDFERIFNFRKSAVWTLALDPAINIALASLYDLMEHSRDSGVPDRIDIAAFNLAGLLAMNRDASRSQSDFCETAVRNAASYFNIHYHSDIDIDAVAKKYGMSRSAFGRHWNKYFHVTPAQYILELKLAEAKNLLLTHRNMKVADIAKNLNFRETNYFCALFRRRFGLTPLQFRFNGRFSDK